MNTNDSQQLESYLPVYDVAPETYEEGRAFLVEQLKRIAEAVNSRSIGFYLDQEILTGKSFVPGVNNNQQFRSILRTVVIVGAITAGLNTIAHGISVTNNFTLIDLWASATNSTTFRSVTFGNPDTIYMDQTNIYITSDGDYDRCNAFVEYLQEL